MSLYMEPIREVLKNRGSNPIEQDCLICDKKVLWLIPELRVFHVVCFKKIRAAEDNLIKTINDMFPKENEQKRGIEARVRAIKAVKAACAPDSILVFLKKNGEKKLKELFDTIGIEAAAKAERAKL